MKNSAQLLFLGLSLLMLCMPERLPAQNEKKDEKGISKYDRANAEYLLIDAQKFFLLEDYERVLAFLEQSLEVDPNNHAAYFKQAETYLAMEKYDLGLEAIGKAQSLLADNKYYYLLGVRLCKEKKDLEGAARQYELMRVHTLDHKAFLPDLVALYVALKNDEKALKTLEAAEKAFGNADKFMFQKKDLLVQSGRIDEAIEYLKSLLDKNQNNQQLLTEYTALMTKVGRENEVIRYLESLPHAQAASLLVKCYLRKGFFKKAQLRLTSLLENNRLGLDEEIELAAALAQIASVAQLKTPESLPFLKELMEHLVARAPENAQVLEIQSRLLTLMDSDKTAGEATDSEIYRVWLKLKESDPSNFQNWKRVLEYEYKHGHWKALLKNAPASLDYFPNQGLFYFYSGAASLYAGALDEAADLLNQSLRLSFSNDSLKAETLGKLGELSFAMNQPEQAQQHFKKALATLRLPEIINNYGYELALRQWQPEQALKLVEEARASAPNRLKYISTEAFVHFQQGSYQRARQLMEEGLNRLPQQVNDSILKFYGDILMKLNLADLAVAQWQKAKALKLKF